jgi:hypothetical protein
MELLVLHIPGLSARLLRDQMAAAVNIARVGGEGTAATLVTIYGASPAQLEAALLTGMLPEYLGAFAGGVGDPRTNPFWIEAAGSRALRSLVDTSVELPPAWRGADTDPQFRWHTLRSIADQGPTRAALHEAEREAHDLLAQAQAAVVVAAWAYDKQGNVAPQACDPLDRPVLLSRGIDQPKTCIGILEVAGILERTLTGEVVRDTR